MAEMLQKDRDGCIHCLPSTFQLGEQTLGTEALFAPGSSAQLLAVPASQLEFQPGCPQVLEKASRI